MITKKSKLTLLVLILAVFVACDKNDVDEQNSLPEAGNLIQLTAQEYASIAFDTPRELSEEEAITIAKDFINSKEAIEAEKLGTKASSSNASFKVNTKYYCGTDNSKGIVTRFSSKNENAISVPVYELSVVNGDEAGLVIVSGDERAQKVIVYIPQVNKENNSLPSEAEYFKELAKINLVEGIEEIIQLQESLRDPTIIKIAEKLGVDPGSIKFEEIQNYLSVNNEPLSKFQPIQTPPSQVLSYVLPMCKAQWDQDPPYNRKLPTGNILIYPPDWYEQGNYPAGCGVIAVAQIMSIIQPSITAYGTTMNWSYLLQNPSIVEPDYFNPGDPQDKRDMVAKLILDIYTRTGSFPQSDGTGITGVSTYDSECEKYIKLYANCLNRQKWNSDVVRNSILALRPVLVTGEGTLTGGGVSKHAFIVDGYLLCKLYYGAMSATVNDGTKELVKLYDLYFHANFGWNGTGDGYYLINKDTSIDFEAGPATYKTGNLNIIANIVKK